MALEDTLIFFLQHREARSLRISDAEWLRYFWRVHIADFLLHSVLAERALQQRLSIHWTA